MKQKTRQARQATPCFSLDQLAVLNDSVAVAEEMVCDYYKMSASQWLRHRYDVKTRAGLSGTEIVEGPFAQIVRYAARGSDASLGSSVYDFYKICVQDPAILSVVSATPGLSLFPFLVYVIVHELVHIIRFARFDQHFDAPPEEKEREEGRVHRATRAILVRHEIAGMAPVLKFYEKWETCQAPVDL
ncbi:hypothetical protein [Desulfosudis oleivorans]|uniref:SprT-like domain-containing protein n=1 Tax=Desulfosudis oleivorans (strain DSM 6200 / JCM 39069 / Hxd3) TaxID=96561 RepID=A8ZU45_DESOH|nr:hypothetical protein [Desulfosudis oleivorans]ABW66357.1 conserved hypothetical protein [Desulfosudis oleivorans Hxd3]